MPRSIDIAGDVLTIRQLAEYLMVSEKTVYRMLDRNELPAVRVGAQWRFRKQDIDAWLNEEVRRVEYEGKRGALDAGDATDIAIAPLLSPGNVWLDLAPASRDELLTFMISSATLDGAADRDQLLRSILEREAVCSTAVLESAAFPHPVDPRPFRFPQKRILLAALRTPLVFLDPHGHRPSVVAIILARSVQGQLLALSRAIKIFADSTLIERLTKAASASEAIALIAAAEQRLNIAVPKESA